MDQEEDIGIFGEWSVLLKTIDKEVTEEEFPRLKRLCGQFIDNDTLGKLGTTLELLQELEQRELISFEDFGKLEDLLRLAKRSDLVSLVQSYDEKYLEHLQNLYEKVVHHRLVDPQDIKSRLERASLDPEAKEIIGRGRIMLVGAFASGKTSTKRSLVNERYNSRHISTDGADMYRIDITEWVIRDAARQHGYFSHDSDIAAKMLEKILVSTAKKNVGSEETSELVEWQISDNSNASDETDITNMTRNQRERSHEDQQQININNYIQLNDETTYHIDSLLETVQDVDDPDLHFTLWDFAGQNLYYTTHQAFLGNRVIYILVTDLLKSLDDIMNPNPDSMTADDNWKEKEFLSFWMHSIHTHAKPGGKIQVGLQGRVKKDVMTPPIIVIGTKKDQLGEEQATKQLLDIKRYFDRAVGPANEHIVDYIAIANKPGDVSGKSDPEIETLRHLIKNLASHPFFADEVPLKWVILEFELRKQQKDTMKLKEIYKIGKDVNLSEEVVDEALAFFHSIGEILHFVNIPNIRDTVILNVAWLVDLFRIIVTQSVIFKTDLKAPAEVTCQIDDLLNEGKLYEGLVDYLLERHNRSQDKVIVLEVMENYDIIYKMSDSEYYLPCLLRKEAEEDDIMLPDGSVSRRAINFHFAGNFLPEGIFYRLVVRCLKEWSTEYVKLLKHQARIYMEEEGFHVTLRKRKADIELNILVSNGQPITSVEAAQATAVRVLVETQLQYLIKTYTPGLSFRQCVKCPCKRHDPESTMPGRMDLDDRCVDINQAGHSLNAVCKRSVTPVPRSQEDMKLWFSQEYHVPRQQSGTPTQPSRQSPVMPTKKRKKHGQRTQDVCHDTKHILEKKARIGISQRSERNVSGKKILLVNDEWGTTKGGISTVNRQVAQLVAETQQEVYVTALEACKEDKEDAESKGIHLVLPTETQHTEKESGVYWLTYHSDHFPQIQKMENVKVVIGHMPITGKAALKIHNDCFPPKKVKAVLFNHVIPEDTEIHKDTWTPEEVQKREDELISQAKMADVVFSVGPRIHSHFKNKYRKLSSIKHELFLPMPDERFFAVSMKRPSLDCKIQITTFGRVKGVANLKGYDLAAAALSRVVESRSRKKPDQDPPVWLIRGIPEGHGEESKKYVERHITTGHLQCNLYPYGTQDQIRDDLQQSHLCLMPSRSEPFGMVGLEAIATGVPVLLTKHSGLAKFLIKYFPEEMHKEVLVDAGLNDTEKEKDVQLWAEHIERTLDNYDTAFNRAQRMKELLKHSETVRETHEVFKKVCCE